MRCNLSFCKSAWWPHCHRCHGQNVNIPTQHTLLTQDAARGLMPPLCFLGLSFIRILLSHPLILKTQASFSIWIGCRSHHPLLTPFSIMIGSRLTPFSILIGSRWPTSFSILLLPTSFSILIGYCHIIPTHIILIIIPNIDWLPFTITSIIPAHIILKY